MKLQATPNSELNQSASEVVCLHFDQEALPQLVCWELCWYQHQEQIVRQEARQGRGFHWNLSMVSLCLALVRLELLRGQPAPLLRGARGTAVGRLAHSLFKESEVAEFHLLLGRPETGTAADTTLRLHRWFNVVNGTFRQDRPALVYAGSEPPCRVVVRVGSKSLNFEGMRLLESKLAWMAEERDWLGSVMRPGVTMAA